MSSVVSRDDVDYLNDNLLLDDHDVSPIPSPNYRPPDPPSRQVSARRSSTGDERQVIAIDYGTTFTGW